MISIFVAIDDKRGIGKDNDLLFKIPEDFRRMKELTTGHPIIMGRRTFESIGRVLPNRTNIVITRDSSFKFEGIVVVHSLEEALDVARKSTSGMSLRGDENDEAIYRDRRAPLAMTNENEVFIFGGGQIFKEAIEKGLVDRLYLTIVDGDYGADTFFPDYSEFKKMISEEVREADGYRYKFLVLEK